MNLAGHRDWRLSENYFEHCKPNKNIGKHENVEKDCHLKPIYMPLKNLLLLFLLFFFSEEKELANGK